MAGLTPELPVERGRYTTFGGRSEHKDAILPPSGPMGHDLEHREWHLLVKVIDRAKA